MDTMLLLGAMIYRVLRRLLQKQTMTTVVNLFDADMLWLCHA
jgi:hypothetical protein